MKIFVKVLKILFIVILALVLIFNLIIMIQSKSNPDEVPGIFGYKPFVVTSGSMESEISVGDLVFVKNIDAKELKVDDIIAFRDSQDLVTTHRIVEELELEGKRCYRTKGDNNNTVDEAAVCESEIEGKYVGKLAGIGNFILVMMLIILIICMVIYFISNRNANKMDEEELKAFEEFKKQREKGKK